ncbi:MAG: YdiY family protein [Sphingorhabdus sp.]
MIDSAIASKNDADVQTVVKLAKATNPDDIAEIDALFAAYAAEKTQLAAAETRAKQEAGFFSNWSGEGELGAFRSTGNSSNTGISGGIKLTKDAVKWRVKLRAFADYQRSNGITTREQFGASIEPNYKFNERLYAYGLAQYERDRFQGFSSRYTLSGGLGYAVIAEEDISLDVKAGPAWRKTNFTNGGSDSSIAGLAGLDFGWQISDNLKLTESASATIASDTNTFVSTTALDAKLLGSLSARLSYTVEHETNPPIGRIKTDTLSRATLVYGF